MNKWEKYSRAFSDLAKSFGYSKAEIQGYLAYAQNLVRQRLPIIYDQKHFSMLVGYRLDYLRRISNSQNNFYRSFVIPKKSGGERTISEPLPNLKIIQAWILDEIISKGRVSGYAKAYVKGRSIKDNAFFHINQKVVLTIDIEDFFGSLKYKPVLALFQGMGYSKSVSTLLANLCTLDGSLPQGAPTSPTISNLLMRGFDKRLAGFCKKHNIKFTRYADDMTFSGDFEPGMVVKFVGSLLSLYNLKINHEKIRARRQNQRQQVTGVVVNKKMQVPKNKRRELRQAIYYIRKFGLHSHLERMEHQRANYLRHLLGVANHILFINPSDSETMEYYVFLRDLLLNR